MNLGANRTSINRTLALLVASMVCAAPPGAHSGEVSPPISREEASARLERRSMVAPARTTISSDYLSQRIEWLRLKDPRHGRALVYLDGLIGARYDPFLLDAWLDGLYDGVVVVGMPGDLVVSYFGNPLSRVNVVYEGVPAQEWGVRLLPHRIEKVTVAGGKVVRVRS